MKHTSIKVNMPCEFINITPVNPQISKCQIKVCYVGDKANRNGSIITKEVAKKIANSLPGSPIVGYYNPEKKDFDKHNKIWYVDDDGKLKMESLTRPYGFVDLGARCWFQKYIDDAIDEREYLMTEGYLWTDQYPECASVIQEGRAQSMELNDKMINAHWTKDDNNNPQFFIINDALISKLCILGEDTEPCFEGSNVTAPEFEFSFGEDFKAELKQMIFQLQETLNKGGNVEMEEKNNAVQPEVVEEVVETAEETQFVDKKQDEEEICPNCGKPLSECTCDKDDDDDDDKKKSQYSIEDDPKYQELQTQYSTLENKYNELINQTNELNETISSLKEFKANAEKKEKQALIDEFYMLSAEDKADVVNNIDTYSLEDIENKLSVICFRNKVDFNMGKETETKEEEPTTYTAVTEDDSVPAWVKAVKAAQASLM